MNVVDLAPNNESTIEQVAALLVEGFAAHSPKAWPDLAAGLAEVRESFGSDCISRIALDESGEIPGSLVR